MLRTGFIGSDNLFDKYICYWLREHSDLRLIIWTDQLEWAAGPRRWRKIAMRYRQRARRHGWVRVADEVLYYALYHSVLRHRDARKIRALIEELAADGGRVGGLEDIEQIRPDIRQIRPPDIQAPEVLEATRGEQLDALFSMCISMLLPKSLITAPRLGSFLWHEGITPEYRGVHSPFWALANRDYEKLGYSLLKMDMKFDAGDVFVQGTARDVDPLVDSPSYIGHKAILDSLRETERFLKELERGEHVPLERVASEDRLYSYPTASALAKIIWHRRRATLRRLLGSPDPRS
jgi:formyl transferase-like protein